MPFARNHVCAEVRISYKACQIGLDRWLSRQPSTPAAKEWVKIRGHNNATATRETTEVWNVARVFAPVTVQKHDILATLQLGKDALSPAAEDADASGEASLQESLFGKFCMMRVSFNSVHVAVRSSRGSHHSSRVPVTTTNLQHSSRVR